MAAAEVGDLGYFEEDVIAEILARLPVKSLKRFRCVCKPWCALISASYFVKKHLSYQERGITESPRRLIFGFDPALALDCEAFKTTQDYESSSVDCIIPLDLSVKITNRDFVWGFHFGSCNGLVCVNGEFTDGMFFNDLATDSKALILWNPCTRDFTVLPNHPPRESKFSIHLNGLGYDLANDDYKVIQGFISDSDSPLIHIFSLKTGSWKTAVIKDIDVCLESHEGLFVNGALHWLSLSYPPEGSGSIIVSFDLGAEQFQKTVPLPYDDPFIHSNCLCVCTRPTETNCINLWMMKQYGVKESWTELARISLDNIVLDPVDSRQQFYPLCFLENGVVLIDGTGIGGERLVLFYDLKDKIFTHCVEVAIALDNCFETVIYQETLVSPDLYGCNAKPTL